MQKKDRLKLVVREPITRCRTSLLGTKQRVPHFLTHEKLPIRLFPPGGITVLVPMVINVGLKLMPICCIGGLCKIKTILNSIR